MEYFVISAKFAEILYTLIATAASNLVFSWVVRVGEFCHPELPGNAKIVYNLSFLESNAQFWCVWIHRPSRHGRSS